MITIIHGDDIVASRAYFNEQKSKAETVFSFSGVYSLTQLMQAFEGSLFTESPSIFIENLLSKKKNTEKDDIIAYLAKQKNLGNVCIWEDAELSLKNLQAFKIADIKSFKLPKLLFTFVDTIQPAQGKQLIKLFHELLSQTDADFVFAMIVRQFRLLLACHPESNEGYRGSSLTLQNDNTIDEVKRLSPWQIAKIKKQRSFFTREQLLLQHSKLFNIDSKLKTGTLSLSLIQAIDFFLLDL